jgi:hypothetical protein
VYSQHCGRRRESDYVCTRSTAEVEGNKMNAVPSRTGPFRHRIGSSWGHPPTVILFLHCRAPKVAFSVDHGRKLHCHGVSNDVDSGHHWPASASPFGLYLIRSTVRAVLGYGSSIVVGHNLPSAQSDRRFLAPNHTWRDGLMRQGVTSS